jgi:hypothetical protein
MSAGIKANNDGSAAIQVGGTDYIQISSTGNVTVPQSQTISGNLVVTGSVTASSGTGNYALQQYVAPTTWTKPAGLKAIKVTIVGAGGNGGGPVPGPGGPPLNYSSAGGGGGAAILYLSAPSITGPVTVTAGPGTNSFGPWNPASPAPTVTASATAGGTGSVGLNTSGGAGGTGVNGTINIVGTTGAGGNAGAGPGGPSIMGGGGSGGNSANNPGSPGNNYGGGGGGAIAFNGPARTGGTGAPGIVIIEEFY